MLLGGGLVVGLSLPALAVSSLELHKLTASDADANDWFGWSVAISDSTALVGAWRNGDAGSFSGSAYLFDVATGSQIAKLTASDAAAGDVFGVSVALSGATAIVGALGNDDACPGDPSCNSGSAYLFDVSDPSNPVQIAKLTASDANAEDDFGYSVALSGATALVGAWHDDDGGSWSGSAYLYDFSDPCSIIEIKLTASDAATNDIFGYSVALSGATAIVGAPANDDTCPGDPSCNSGLAYLYDFSDPCSIIETKLTASDAAAEDNFGYSVAISGSTAIVGAPSNDDAGSFSGSAYLFDVSDPCNPVEIAKLTASDADANDFFGISVALRGSTALVGADGDDDAGTDSGSAYLFDVATGSQIAKLTASDANAGDEFGESVAISSAAAIVGARGDDDDDTGIDSGSAYLFRFCPVGDINLDCRVDFRDFALMAGNWLVDCILEPSDPACQLP
jgi:hypothetical protein